MADSTKKTVHFVLRPDVVSDVGSAAHVQSKVDQIIDRVSKEAGETPAVVRVLPNLLSVGVEASPSYLDSLSAQPEIARRIDPVEDDMLIRPVKREEVSLPADATKPSSGKKS